MTHSDDNGLVLPPKLAPAQVVILPIYRNDAQRAEVLAYCEVLKDQLTAQHYDDGPVRVRLDDRDLRGGEKKWQWVKRGVPLRVEVGPRDVAEGGVFVYRRVDGSEQEGASGQGGGKGVSIPRAALVAQVSTMLAEMQQALFDRAARARDAVTVKIDAWAEFERFFTPNCPEHPEAHGGLVYCHFVDGPEMEAKLKALKVTVRCVPFAGEEEPGKCIFTGQPSQRRALFAKAY
jgi:prolyl-tRNA synthetase